ncbi:DNA-binding protein [Parabacteroides sp. W1-Q-101]|uniref:DNA-binding protein n=1 Tax=Parabacteroides TaxID=375288 RepID=UPI00202FB01F|nr:MULTISPECIES: DNA-binding protein [unclassified Parabacteroides]MCM0722214.1 DNA-binding protein [Parabacteroides sp. W1-Q-101]
MKDLTLSNIERQNILNNRLAVENIQDKLKIEGMLFDGEYRFTKKMVADFYEVDISTIDRYLLQYGEELKHNGYILSKGKQLKEFKLQFAHLINEASKTTQLGLFNFRSFLNIGMMLTDSEKAKIVRSIILDVVIATINEKTGGGTKFINRRDINYLPAAIKEENYRKNLTSTINTCVDGHYTMKYALITDYIYKAVFRENAKEYREILKLNTKDNVRHTLYAEVLLVISSFENGVGAAIQDTYKSKGGIKLTLNEVEDIVNELTEHPMQKPYLSDARTKMASRDFSFRDVYHGNIAEYLQAVTPEEFERFIGDSSIDFDRILEDNKDVLKRLKQADNE